MQVKVSFGANDKRIEQAVKDLEAEGFTASGAIKHMMNELLTMKETLSLLGRNNGLQNSGSEVLELPLASPSEVLSNDDDAMINALNGWGK